MAHFAQSFKQPTLAFQEIINIHFDVSLLYKDHGINSLQTYVDKMAISAICGSLWSDKHTIFCLTNDLQRPIYNWSKNIYLSVNDDFITNSPLQLLQVTNPTNGHYESIIFHNISQLNDKNM
jgi:hypothetical protein